MYYICNCFFGILCMSLRFFLADLVCIIYDGRYIFCFRFLLDIVFKRGLSTVEMIVVEVIYRVVEFNFYVLKVG